MSKSLELFEHYGYTSAAFDGPTLNFVLEFSELRQLFLRILQKANVVIFSRVSSTLKGRLALFARKELKYNTCAIGDGENDNLMLEKADFGIKLS